MTSRVESHWAEISELEQLQKDRAFDRLATRLDGFSREQLIDRPELGFLRALALYHLGRESDAVEIVDDLVKSSASRPRSRIALRLRNLQGVLNFEAGNMLEAETAFMTVQADAFAAKEWLIYAQTIQNVATVALVHRDFDAGLAGVARALALFQQLGERSDFIRCHHNVGMAYREIGLYKAAESHFQHALDFARKSEFLHEVAYIEVERSVLYLKMGDMTLAQKTAERGLEIARFVAYRRVEGEALRALGMIADSQSDWGAARRHYDEALAAADDADAQLLKAEIYEQLTMHFLRTSSIQDARNCAAESAMLYEAMGAMRARDILMCLLEKELAAPDAGQ